MTDPFTQQPLRIGIVDIPFILRLQDLLWDAAKEKAEDPGVFFYDFGQHWGTEFYKELSERIGPAGHQSVSKPQDFLKDEFIEHLNSYLSYTGIGQFRITEGNKFYVINLKNSIDVGLDKPHAENMNVILSGFFGALFSAISSSKLKCTGLSVERSADRNRFALSTGLIIEDIKVRLRNGASEQNILAAYGNQHLE